MLDESSATSIAKFIDGLVESTFKPPAVPQVLHHYTDLPGISGMVTSGEMWATNLAFLNDRKEFDHGIDLLLDRLQALLKTDLPPISKEWAENVYRTIEQNRYGNDPNFYVACFSEARDDLSQWRAYGSNGGGCSLGFTASKLFARTIELGGQFAPVVYNSTLQTLAMDAALKWAVNEVPRFLEIESTASADERILLWNQAFFGHLEKFAPFFKSSAFEAEREWRAVFQIKTFSEFKFRARKDHMVSYKSFDMQIATELNPNQIQWLKEQGLADRVRFLDDSTTRLLPLHEVIVGPGDRDLLSFKSLKNFLWANGYFDVGPKFSNIPYRNVT